MNQKISKIINLYFKYFLHYYIKLALITNKLQKFSNQLEV